jgi:hypothetical protein
MMNFNASEGRSWTCYVFSSLSSQKKKKEVMVSGTRIGTAEE